jgi:hypothetical protein
VTFEGSAPAGTLTLSTPSGDVTEPPPVPTTELAPPVPLGELDELQRRTDMKTSEQPARWSERRT